MKKKLLLGILAVFITFTLIVKVNALEYKTYNIGDEVKYNPITGSYCDVNQESNCFTFNVVSVADSTIELMLNKNLVATSTWGNSTDGPVIAMQELREATQSWVGVIKYDSETNARMISFDEVESIMENIGTSMHHNQSTGSYVTTKNTKNDWMVSDVNGSDKYGYWTSTKDQNVENKFWAVIKSHVGTIELESNQVDQYITSMKIGVRPIIKVTKEEITSHIILFDKGDGTGEMESLVVTGTSFKIPESKFTAPKGKEFDYWQVGEEKLYPGDTYTIDADVTLVAVYRNKKAESSKKSDNIKNNKTKEAVKNPKTGDTLFAILGAITLAGAGFIVTIKKAKQK